MTQGCFACFLLPWRCIRGCDSARLPGCLQALRLTCIPPRHPLTTAAPNRRRSRPARTATRRRWRSSSAGTTRWAGLDANTLRRRCCPPGGACMVAGGAEVPSSLTPPLPRPARPPAAAVRRGRQPADGAFELLHLRNRVGALSLIRRAPPSRLAAAAALRRMRSRPPFPATRVSPEHHSCAHYTVPPSFPACVSAVQ